jgi:hypothetical protein
MFADVSRTCSALSEKASTTTERATPASSCAAQ